MFFKNSKGRNVIRVTDTTDHGGEVITGASNWTVEGKPIARVGDLVRCPQCLNQTYPIIEGDEMVSLEGRRAAFDGHLTACGARLISSLGSSPFSDSSNPGSIGTSLTASAVTGTKALSTHAEKNLGQGYSLGEEKPSVLIKIDERAIIARYREAINYMVRHDLRFRGYGLSPAVWNNAGAVEFGGSRYRCQPQTLFVADWLCDLDLHYDWSFNVIEHLVPLTDSAHHYHIEAVAPIGTRVIKMDPLYDEVSFSEVPSKDIALRARHDYNLIAAIDDERYNSSQKLLPRHDGKK